MTVSSDLAPENIGDRVREGPMGIAVGSGAAQGPNESLRLVIQAIRQLIATRKMHYALHGS
jgi:hypothetical protein